MKSRYNYVHTFLYPFLSLAVFPKFLANHVEGDSICIFLIYNYMYLYFNVIINGLCNIPPHHLTHSLIIFLYTNSFQENRIF